MCTTPTTNINATLQQIAELTASGCDIVRVAVPSPGRRRRAAHHRQEEPDPGHRRHPLPAEVRVPGDRRRVRGRAREPRQHPQVRRPGGRDRQGGQGCRRQHPHRRQRRVARPATAAEVRQGDPRGARRERRLGGVAVRGARLPRLQDLGQAQRPDRDGAGLPAARRAGRLAAAPRRHRGRPRVPGHDQERDGVRHPALRGHRRHHPRLALRPAGAGGQGRPADPAVAQPARAQARDRVVPVVRARPGRRLHARRTTSPRGSRA